MQLALDGLDRLVDALQEEGALSTADAARLLFATGPVSDGLACSLLTDVTAGDSRIVCTGTTVSLAGAHEDPLLEEAEFVVFDLETTGLSGARDRICEVGAARVRALELVDSFQSLVNPRVALPQPITRLTGLREHELRRAPPVSSVIRRFVAFAGDAPLAAHNARFDQRFLERQLQWLHGRRLAEPPLCTAALARRLLEGRVRRVGLASLADFFGVPTRPCHRALPDAESTAQVLVCLIGLAQEVGARRVSDLRKLEAPRKRRVYGKRPLVRGAPDRPGVYLFRDRSDQVLYVGRARDLRARLRSYFRSERQRPSVEAALLALERIEWRVLGSELEAAIEELRLIRELQPPANSRSRRREHGVYLKRRGDDFVVTKKETELGPIPSRRRAALAARALAAATPEERERLLEGGPLPRLRQRLAQLAEDFRYEEAARLRDRIDALEQVVNRLRRLERAAHARALPDSPCARARLAEGVLRLRRRNLRRSLIASRGGGEASDRRCAGALSVRPQERARVRSRPNRPKTPAARRVRRRPPPELAVLPLQLGADLAYRGS